MMNDVVWYDGVCDDNGDDCGVDYDDVERGDDCMAMEMIMLMMMMCADEWDDENAVGVD